jgi:heme/copper-type cytochrome/quinol oxidase subunit 4
MRVWMMVMGIFVVVIVVVHAYTIMRNVNANAMFSSSFFPLPL